MDEEDRLRREAFGRPRTAEEEARAEAALKELAARGALDRGVVPMTAAADAVDAADAARAADAAQAAGTDAEPAGAALPPRAATAARRRIAASSSSSSSSSASAHPAEPSILLATRSVRPAPGPSRLWRVLPAVAAVAAAALVVVVAVGFNSGSEPSSADVQTATQSPSPSDASGYNRYSDDLDDSPAAGDYPRIPHTRVAAVTTGSAVSAQSWFASPQTDADAVNLHMSVFVDPTSTRLVPTNADPRRVWVAENGEGKLCLVLEDAVQYATATARCATPEDFDSSGLTVSSDELTAFWDGFTVKTTLGIPPSL